PDGKLLAVGAGNLELWDFAAERVVHVLGRVPFQSPLAFTPDGAAAALGGQGTVHLWGVETGKERQSPPLGTQYLYGMAFSAEGKQVATSGDVGGVWLSAAGGDWSHLHQFRLHESVADLVYSPDGRWLGGVNSGASRSRAYVWDVPGRKAVEVPPHG